MKLKCVQFLAFILLGVLPASGQTATGTILGAIRDPQAAPVPRAKVIVINTASNTSRTFVTDETGAYLVPLLAPGEYQIAVEAAGFRRSSRSGITLQVNDRRMVDFQLEIGALSEQISVKGDAPLLETTTNTLGQVIENRRIVDLPLNGREPISLAQLTPGVLPVSRGAVPIHMGGSIPQINGAGNGASEVLLDGTNDTVPRNNYYMLIHTPSVDAVEEFKVETNSLSAEYGRFAGGVITIATKSGTNQVHGTGYWFLRNSEFDANDFFNNRAGVPLGSVRRNQGGFTVGGPVVLPKVYNGKSRTFFFVDWERFREALLAPSSFTVPLVAERTGDFSQTVTSQGQRVTIYDPMAVSGSGSTLTRSPFPGNIIPANRISPVAAKMMPYYPLPTNNRVSSNLVIGSSRLDNNDTFDLRADHNFTDALRVFTRLSYQQPRTGEANYFSNIATPTNPPLEQRRRSATMQGVYTISPTLILDFQYGITYMHGERQAWSDGYDITQLGFATNYRDAQQVRALPVMSMSGYTGLGNGAQNYSTQTSEGFQSSITKIKGNHSIKAGFEYRAYYNNQLQNNQAEGTLNYGTNFTQGPNPNQASSTAGNGIATFLLGYPSGSLRIQPATAYRSSYQASYVQEDWRIHPKLTLNLGFRWDIYQPRTERYDRISIFDPTLPSPIAAQVPGYDLKGQMLFRDSSNRRLSDTHYKNFGPRVGLAWSALRNTTVRAGYGIFYGLAPTDASLSGTYADGFTATTSVISTIDGTTPVSNTANPYPSGVNLPLARSALGPGLFLGQTVSSLILSFSTPYVQQWNFSLQRAVGKSVLVEAAYAGAKGTHLSFPALNINVLTADQTALGPANQQLVPNPFYGVITDPTSTLSLPTIQRGQLIRPFPQYSSVTADYPSIGNSSYHSFLMRVEKRFSNGFTLLASLTVSKLIDDCTQAEYGSTSGVQDPTNLRAERAIDPQDVSRRLVVSGVWELPIGRGRPLGRNWVKPVDLLLGGWQLNGIMSYQTGLPLIMTSIGAARPNRIAAGTPPAGPLATHLDHAFDTSAYAVPPAFTFGNSSRTAPDMRADGIRNYDLSMFKNWRIRERLKAQFRVEAFNAFNTPQFSPPGTQAGTTSFGVISSQFNQPRQVQLALKLIY